MLQKDQEAVNERVRTEFDKVRETQRRDVQVGVYPEVRA